LQIQKDRKQSASRKRAEKGTGDMFLEKKVRGERKCFWIRKDSKVSFVLKECYKV
jgi:hypothetical protein